ncbi:probable Na(+)/H(+) antiporter NhaH at N-terminal half [Coccomyxa sp. Obi]|nr:probable Na(+)/H(+) antiporter NhaH at N-terminal half [Coccomyxa sp. Obi]
MVADAAHHNVCLDHKVTYTEHWDNKENYTWCTVPESSYDVLLFPAIAVVLACLFQGRMSTTLVLISGGVIQAFMFPTDGGLGRLGNSIAWWLGIEPYELFLYVFLPPLLLDAAVRIDFFLFKKAWVKILTLAFLVVIGSCGLLIPIMLYMLDLRSDGWTWQYVALFGSMCASTDAVAIVATMKTSGGPKSLRLLLEGESLLNDASSITLFTIFLSEVDDMRSGHVATAGEVIGNIVSKTLWLAVGGALIGLAFGIVMRYLLRWMRHLGAGIEQQVAMTFAIGYLSYYTANAPAAVSGVIAVAVFGLYGAATSKWDMSAKVEESGAFDAFWDAIAFIVNAIVFFFSGVACINFFVRSAQELQLQGQLAAFAGTLWRFPLVYLIIFIVRFLLICLFRPLFRLSRQDLPFTEIAFATVAGLRGSVSLILTQAVVVDPATRNAGPEVTKIKAEIVLWTAGFVLLTLVINAPLLPLFLRVSGLANVGDAKMRMRRRAVRAMLSHTSHSIRDLRNDEDEMLRGVDWGGVEKYVDLTDCYQHYLDPCYVAPKVRVWYLPWTWCYKAERKKDLSTQTSSHNGSHHMRHTLGKRANRSMNSSGLDSNFTMMEADRVFGRASEWSGPADLETGIADEETDGGSGSDSDDGSSDNNELPFLARASVVGVRASQDRAGLEDKPVKLNRESQAGPMELPEAVEAITGMNASHLPAQEELPGGKKCKDGAATPKKQESASLDSAASLALSPRARSAAKAVQAAACKVVITPGGPLPLPAGAAWTDTQLSTAYNFGTPAQDRITKATRALKQLRTGAPGNQGTLHSGSLPSPRTLPGSSGNSSAPSSQSVHDSQMSLPAPAVEMISQSSRSRTGILRVGGIPSGDAEQVRGGSPTVSWHRSVTGKADMQRRPPLSNIFPAAGRPSPDKPRSNLSSVSPQKPPEDVSMGDMAAGSSEADKLKHSSPTGSMPAKDADSRAAVGSSSTQSWPRSVAHGESPRPSLLTAFPTVGQGKPPSGQAAVTIPKSSSGDDLVRGSVKQAAERGTLSSTTSWPRAATQGQDARPSLFQAFPDAGKTLSPGSPTQLQLQQRTASERLAAMRSGSMLPSPTSSWNRSIMHGGDKHRSLFEAFSGLREHPDGENAQSVSTFGGVTGQKYAAAARSGSVPHDPGSSWPRSVMHGSDKHRSLFEAFGNLKPLPAGGDEPSAAQSYMQSAIKEGDTRPALKSAFDSARESTHDRTWAAGDKGTQALGLALKHQLSQHSTGPGGSQTPSASGHEGQDVKGANAFETAEDEEHNDTTVFHPSELAERRVRLAIGLKRYFHGKRLEGLLSTQALRVLDNAMDTIIDKPDRPLKGWTILERDASGGRLMRWFAHAVYILRKTVIRLRRRKPDSNSCWQAVRRGFAWPLLQAGQLAHVVLSKTMLLSCEVALEYMLGLTYAPQVQLLRANAMTGALLQEVDRELGQVWRFILEREVEAPERFQAIQSYRATMAVLRQQANFVHQLFDSGVVDDIEREELLTPIDRRERQLARKGPVWRSPMAFDVLRNLPFLRHVPPRAVEVVLRHGKLHMCRNQEMVRSGKDGRGLFIVINGLVRIGYRDPLGNTQEYFLGTGGISGLFHALTGEHLPGGRLEAMAEGNALGKGPVVFEVHQSAIEIIRRLAANGDATFQQVEVDMFRMAALFVVERLKPWLMTYLAALLATAAPAPSNIHLTPRDDNDETDADEGPFVGDKSFTGALSTTDFENASLEDIQEVGRARVWDAYLQLVQSLTSSELVELPANTTYRHCSSAVLLRGIIRTSGSHCSVVQKTPAGNATSPEEDEMLEYKAPFILPWVVLNKDMSPEQPESFVPFVTGPEGAILMVCTRENAPGVKEASVLDLSAISDDLPKPESSSSVSEADGAASGKKAAAEDDRDTVADLPTKPTLRRVNTKPNLARHSITRAPPLKMVASDIAAEMVSPAEDQDKDSNWWRNRKPPAAAAKQKKSRDDEDRPKDKS